MKKKTLSFMLFLIFVLNAIIVFSMLGTGFSGNGNSGTIRWKKDSENIVHNIVKDCSSDYEKVLVIREWVINNISYDEEASIPLFQYYNFEKTIKSGKGICFEQAATFATMCRIENIQCYIIDGHHNKRNVNHSWNRFVIDGKAYQIDITNDQCVRTTNSKYKEYGIREIDSYNCDDKDFSIYRIY